MDFEQLICISCGFCCDGTLFINAILEPGEKRNLPEKIENNYYKNEEKEYFKLPCPYFSQKCTIYYQKKAKICSSFRCKLLKDFVEKEIAQADAIELINNSKNMRFELLREINALTGKKNIKTVRDLFLALGKIQKKKANYKTNSGNIELFTAKCNIFESLLIKHFKSEKDFGNLIMSPD